MILKPSSSLRVFCGLALMSVAVLAQTRGPSQKELTGAIEDSQNWLYVDHDYHGTRFSGLDEISSTNVQRLGQACLHTFPDKEPCQTAPIAYKGVASATTAHYTIALDASNCRVLWQHKWQPKSREVVMTQRGAAVKAG